ncbi:MULTISPECIES: DUF2690 domain-containing protein [unclassified Streptomyces]|uniref:helix-turn-helix domain-containing protein n=1 Tax=unclassified Streptomyces TaxID=2593676 RepID=UPI00382159C3
MTPPERARLTVALGELRQRTGLSLAGLAERTTFSKSSWDRYLNGRTLPPRTAVTELCALAGEPPDHYLALRDLTPHPRQAPPAPTSPPSPPPPRPRLRGATVLAVLAAVCALTTASVTSALALLPPPPPPHRAAPRAVAAGPLCGGASCAGQDPMAARCAAAPVTLADHRTATGAWMELRYSPVCGTSWARMWGTRVGDRIDMTPGGGEARVRTPTEADTYVYTRMTRTAPGTRVQACFHPATGAPGECVTSRVTGAAQP